MTTVSLIKCATYDTHAVSDALERALDPFGGMGAFVKKGQKVFLKVNLLLAADPDQAITTHPAVVEAVIRQAQAAGAEVFFGDLPGGFHIGNTRRIYKKCGMAAVAERTGANLPLLEQSGFRERAIPNGRKLTAIHTPKLLDDMDVLINLPKMKTHMQALYTGAIKNLFGLMTTRDRQAAHNHSRFRAFSSALVDIYSSMVPALNIMDAIMGMDGTGPSQGKPRAWNALLASPDAVAMDAVGAALMGLRPGEVLTTEFAARRGLGQGDLSLITVHGGRIAHMARRAKRPSPAIFTMLPLLGGLVNDISSVKPVIDAKNCKKCRSCVEVCPAGAIRTEGDFKIDDSCCILCFCCHEMCEHGAVKLKKAPLVRLAEIVNPR
jgi:uncharacterized protein (DUF362 family)/NAD-dependent dihydropyrimidine dehydrogenase PreA subunit